MTTTVRVSGHNICTVTVPTLHFRTRHKLDVAKSTWMIVRILSEIKSQTCISSRAHAIRLSHIINVTLSVVAWKRALSYGPNIVWFYAQVSIAMGSFLGDSIAMELFESGITITAFSIPMSIDTVRSFISWFYANIMIIVRVHKPGVTITLFSIPVAVYTVRSFSAGFYAGVVIIVRISESGVTITAGTVPMTVHTVLEFYIAKSTWWKI